jgi:uncharacterized protein with NRDE domain
MCTLVAFIHVWPGAPLVIAANRDERLDRAASDPTRWVGERFFAPRDDHEEMNTTERIPADAARG